MFPRVYLSIYLVFSFPLHVNMGPSTLSIYRQHFLFPTNLSELCCVDWSLAKNRKVGTIL